MNPTLTRLGNRAKREVVHRFPPASWYADARRAAAVERHRPLLPELAPAQRAQVRLLQEHGFVGARWDHLGLPGTEELKALLLQLAGLLADQSARGRHSVLLGRDETLEDIRLWQWGLRPEVLDLVENHLGVPVRYFGPLVHREVADGRTVDTRQWHRDIEDMRMVKMLVWLNDVDDDGGPFTYIPRRTSEAAARELRYVGGFVSDDRFAEVVAPSIWRRVTGPQWTAGMPDTARIFHRAAPPVARDRYSMTFTWMTRRPLATMPAPAWRPDQVRRCVAGLDSRQRLALPPAMLAAEAGRTRRSRLR
ncbi:hypothetical protein GHK92_12515 [Nocardioides sp. dk4132]|uniref:hypothetical protein n=1 Tax=unclassified Nocardioides TaxID=2615069 RepID=UPI0012952AA5|nr:MULTISPECIES: hypothetical protein [unclassified Nocardioides]MQW76701.1 hypothetical protein [Nocardioides sp. dk4132]QGA06940.1 hypothetical protein GFH29_05705 [Nocardioides sp. dk884]